MAIDPSLYNLQIYHTGAGSNSVPTNDTGGAISSARILSQAATALTKLTGITIVDGLGNGVGDGTLSFTASTKKITWQPYGGSVGSAVTIDADGGYTVQGANDGGALLITVVAASLPTPNTTDTTTISNKTEQFYLNTTKAQSDAGFSKYHCFAIKNTHATDPIVGIKMWIAENTPGADTWSIALDSLAASNGAVGPTPVTNETTSPGLTFYTPTSKTDANVLDIGTLTASQVRFFWIKNLTPASVDTATAENTFKLGIYCKC